MLKTKYLKSNGRALCLVFSVLCLWLSILDSVATHMSKSRYAPATKQLQNSLGQAKLGQADVQTRFSRNACMKIIYTHTNNNKYEVKSLIVHGV